MIFSQQGVSIYTRKGSLTKEGVLVEATRFLPKFLTRGEILRLERWVSPSPLPVPLHLVF